MNRSVSVFTPGDPPQYSAFASSLKSASADQETNLNGPEPIGLLKKPSVLTVAAGAIGSSTVLAASVPTGFLVLIRTVESSGVSTASTAANSGATGPLRLMTRSRVAFTSAAVTLLPSWNLASLRRV